MQHIDYNGISDNIVSYLKSCNTTTATYDLSLNLTNRIGEISRDDLYIVPKFKSLHPSISVRLDSKTEEMEDFNSNKIGRRISLNYKLYMVYDSFDFDITNYILTLTRNVETNMRAYPNLNNYKTTLDILYCIPGNMQQVQINKDNQKFNQSTVVDLQIVGYLDGVDE